MVSTINEFTVEQCEQMKQHIKTMMDTNILKYIIQFSNFYNISDSSHDKELISVTEPSYEYGQFKNCLTFSTFNEIDRFVMTCFHSYKEFFNQMYMIQSYTKMSQYIQNVVNYLNNDPSKSALKRELESMHYKDIIFITFNLHFKDSVIKESFIPNYGEKNFYNDELTDMNEIKHFMIKRYCNTIFSFEYRYKIEHELNKFLLNYRHGLTDFSNAETYMKHAEEIFISNVVDMYDTQLKLKFGIDNRFKNSIEEIINKLTSKIVTEKIQYSKIEYKYTYEKTNNLITDIYNFIHDVCPELTKNMITGYYKCHVIINFKNTLSMQVKKSFQKFLYNYCNDNNIRPIRIEYDEDKSRTGRTKITSPVSKVVLTFYCNDFESIGVDPIRFLIPKMTA